MENENQDFEQLKKLLALKKHEQPPPRYFNEFSGNVISRIRAEQAREADPMRKLKSEAPWLLRLWQVLEAKPMFAGAFGAAVCGLMLAGIVMAKKPAEAPTFAGPRVPLADPVVAATPVGMGGGLDQPVMMATNQTGQNLFDLIPNLQTAPVGVAP